MKKASDLIAAIMLTLVALALTLLGPEHNAARALVGVPFVLVLPGFAIAAATFPRPTLTWTERILLSTGLSLAIAALSGLLLNFLPGGLQTSSWVILLAVITLGSCVTAFFRRTAASAGTVEHRGLELGWRQASVFGLAGVIVAAALVFSAQGMLNQPSAGFTQLWLLPTDANTTSVRVGVSNQDQTTASYVLQLDADGRQLQEWTVNLVPGDTWEQTFALPANISAAARVEAKLTRSNTTGVYRQAWIDRGRR